MKWAQKRAALFSPDDIQEGLPFFSEPGAAPTSDMPLGQTRPAPTAVARTFYDEESRFLPRCACGAYGTFGSGSVCVTARKERGGAAPAGARLPRADRRTPTACSKGDRPRHEISIGRRDLGAGRRAHSVPRWAGDRRVVTSPPRAWLLIVMGGLRPSLPHSPTIMQSDTPARGLKARSGQAGSGL